MHGVVARIRKWKADRLRSQFSRMNLKMVFLLAGVCLTAGLLYATFRSNHVASGLPDNKENSTVANLETKEKESTRFNVSIRPGKHPAIHSGVVDDKGNAITIACATCHTTKPANSSAILGTPLKQFHQNLNGQHGKLSCTSCHNSNEGYSSLRLADGRSVPFTEVMTLCAQCHGPQYRDYQHGAHGGMNGYWDLSKGPRQRNNCVDCHNAHSPKYPTVNPAQGPNDRFLAGGSHE